MSRKYKFGDNGKLYFISFVVVYVLIYLSGIGSMSGTSETLAPGT
ncbi:MAG: hypothetical protein QM768_17520 [Agriterribacter sp.]